MHHRAASVTVGVIAVAASPPAAAARRPRESVGAGRHGPRQAVPPALRTHKSRRRRSVPTSGSVADVQLSPDGSRIVSPYQTTIARGRRTRRSGRLTSLERHGAARWPGGAEGSAPRWSPDGRQVAFIGRPATAGAACSSRTPTARTVLALADVNTYEQLRCRNWATASRGRPTASRSPSSRPCRPRAGHGRRPDRHHAVLVSPGDIVRGGGSTTTGASTCSLSTSHRSRFSS